MWDFAETQNFTEDQQDRHLVVATEFIYNLVTEPLTPYGTGTVAYLHNMEVHPLHMPGSGKIQHRLENRERKVRQMIQSMTA